MKKKNYRIAVTLVAYDPDKYEVRGNLLLHSRADPQEDKGVMRSISDCKDVLLPIIGTDGSPKTLERTLVGSLTKFFKLFKSSQTLPGWMTDPAVVLEVGGPVEY